MKSEFEGHTLSKKFTGKNFWKSISKTETNKTLKRWKILQLHSLFFRNTKKQIVMQNTCFVWFTKSEPQAPQGGTKQGYFA